MQKIQALTEAVIVKIQVNRKSILFELVIYDIVKISIRWIEV